MRLSFGMEARQTQTQKLAPKMIQSMEILQLPIMALQERIEQEMNDNPMLELDEPEPGTADEEAETEAPTSKTEDERELVVKDDSSNAEDFERLANMDNDMPDTFDDFRPSASRVQESVDRHTDLMANAAERPESLNDYLLHQLSELDIDTDIELIAERIISCLDARNGGYLTTPLADILHRSPAFRSGQGGRSTPNRPIARTGGDRRKKPARVPVEPTKTGEQTLRTNAGHHR